MRRRSRRRKKSRTINAEKGTMKTDPRTDEMTARQDPSGPHGL
jgi:hypothetical protein